MRWRQRHPSSLIVTAFAMVHVSYWHGRELRLQIAVENLLRCGKTAARRQGQRIYMDGDRLSVAVTEALSLETLP